MEYEVLCQVSGSQPPSEVTWRLGEVALPTEEEPRLTHDNNLTTSTLFFMPKIKDQARRFFSEVMMPKNDLACT